MSPKFKIILIKIGLNKVNNANINKWITDEQFDILDFVFDSYDFRIKCEILNSLQNVRHERAIYLFEKGLNIKILPVIEASIRSIKVQGLYPKYSKRIENILKTFKLKNEQFRKNWNKPPRTTNSLYIDKSKMVRLKQLKELLAKPKSSMSIG